MRIAIHQPAFFPHERLLQKIAACDALVLLTHAQFEKNGYQNRFRHQDRWYTMSVNHGLEPITDKRYVNPEVDWNAIKRRLPEYPLARDFNALASEYLAATNIAIIRRCCERLNIHTELVLDYPTELRGTARLVDLCQHYGATTYLSGPSGAHYLDRTMFEQAGIALEIQPGGATRSCLEALYAPL